MFLFMARPQTTRLSVAVPFSRVKHRAGNSIERSLTNPINFCRLRFQHHADVAPVISLGVSLGFLVLSLMIVWRIFSTGYKLRP